MAAEIQFYVQFSVCYVYATYMDNTYVMLDIISTYPLLLTRSSLRATCRRLWGIWLVSYTGQCRHYEYIVSQSTFSYVNLSLTSEKHGRLSVTDTLAISPVFIWDRVVLSRADTEYNTQYKYVLNVSDDKPLFTFTVVIALKYYFEDVSLRYYTYVFTKKDRVNNIEIRWISSINSLCCDIGDTLLVRNMYDLSINATGLWYDYRMNDRNNLCIHDSSTYPITMAETRRLSQFMQSSALDFLNHVPSGIVGG